MNNHNPFLDVRSFVINEAASGAVQTPPPLSSPFLSLFESAEPDDAVDPAAAEYVQLLNELYDEEFDEVLFELASEAAALYETRFAFEEDDDAPRGLHDAERALNRYFAPLEAESQAMLRRLASDLDGRDASGLTESEIDVLFERYRPSRDLSPSFEQFFDKLKGIAKRVVNVAKKGISTVAKVALGPVLGRLVPFVPQIIRQVVLKAMARLPPQLQPIAQQLAKRLPFMKEVEDSRTIPGDMPETRRERRRGAQARLECTRIRRRSVRIQCGGALFEFLVDSHRLRRAQVQSACPRAVG